MLFDIRTYDLKPGGLAAYMDGVRQHAKPIRERYGVRLAGWYHFEVEGAPRVVHIWAYRDAAHMEAAKQSFRADPEWTAQYQPKVQPLLVRTHSQIAEAADFSPLLD